MTRESKIALLVGLGFIICFGVIISGSRQDSSAPVVGSVDVPVDTGLDGRRTPSAPLAAPLPPLHRTRRAPAVEAEAPVVAAPPTPREQPVRVEPAAPQGRPTRMYTVKPGDALSRIARQVYGSSSRSAYMRIYNANRDVLSSPSVVAPGQRLRIPAPQDEPAATQAPEPATLRPAGRTYTVRRGDTMTAIARKTMGSGSPAAVRALHELNRRTAPDANRLRPGMVLVIPR